ncbi:hypothetical protein DEO72_LG7g764 [Vigna unguiculata]|uniref:Uncharacterized protein n=1 Tax=Vigna unguiculata TaxID=3917 RepID=A0A4D6MDF8_VIGUN|nr:hypothetical protein DEO72_LG7g764 [Vigna unguiculata]
MYHPFPSRTSELSTFIHTKPPLMELYHVSKMDLHHCTNHRPETRVLCALSRTPLKPPSYKKTRRICTFEPSRAATIFNVSTTTPFRNHDLAHHKATMPSRSKKRESLVGEER